MKKLLIIPAITLLLVSCGKTEEVKVQMENTPKIEAKNYYSSIVPITSIANSITWENKFESIIQAWTSPHSFDLKTKDLVKIKESDLVLITETTLDEVIHEISEKEVNVSKWIKLMLTNHHHDEHENHGEDSHLNEHSENELTQDPHFWLWTDEAIKTAENIKNELIILSPENKDLYGANFANFKNTLNTLHSDFLELNKDKEPQKFIILHEAYNYLFADLGIHEEDYLIVEDVPTVEANSKKLKELIDTIESKNIKYIYKEPQIESSTLDYLVDNYNIEVLILDPLWTSDSKNWYIENLQQNLNNLQKIYE